MHSLKRVAGPILMLGGFGAALASLVASLPALQSASRYDELPRPVVQDQPAEKEEASSWQLLVAQNDALVGWLTVEGTAIDYPVVKESDDQSGWWLTHDFNNEESIMGCPYVTSSYQPQSPFFTIYAHHLSGLPTSHMFTELARCHEQERFEQTLGTALWITADETERFQPLCALSVDESQRLPEEGGVSASGGLRAWLEGVCNSATAISEKSALLVRMATRCMTLVTCTSDVPGQRQRTLVLFVDQPSTTDETEA